MRFGGRSDGLQYKIFVWWIWRKGFSPVEEYAQCIVGYNEGYSLPQSEHDEIVVYDKKDIAHFVMKSIIVNSYCTSPHLTLISQKAAISAYLTYLTQQNTLKRDPQIKFGNEFGCQ